MFKDYTHSYAFLYLNTQTHTHLILRFLVQKRNHSKYRDCPLWTVSLCHCFWLSVNKLPTRDTLKWKAKKRIWSHWLTKRRPQLNSQIFSLYPERYLTPTSCTQCFQQPPGLSSSAKIKMCPSHIQNPIVPFMWECFNILSLSVKYFFFASIQRPVFLTETMLCVRGNRQG